jgi:hypothetical protein
MSNFTVSARSQISNVVYLRISAIKACAFISKVLHIKSKFLLSNGTLEGSGTANPTSAICYSIN